MESSASESVAAGSASKYAPIAELGKGGMATAYLAAVRGLGGFHKLMVVKRLRPALAAEPEFLRMFLDEARLAARIDHPNVVHTLEVGFDGEGHFIAMEYIEGQSLEQLVRRSKQRSAGPGATAEVLDAAAAIPLKLYLVAINKVLEALQCAHDLEDFDGTALNVVHRDVSPHNVMVTYDGNVKLLDFGIAKAADSSTDTRTGVLKGKCGYMALEQFGGQPVDRRADVFAVGVMLWQAVTGARLWKGLSDADIFRRLASGNVPRPSERVADIDPALEAICMKALAPEAADRYASAAELQAELEGYIAAHAELRATTRELGKFVAESFAVERAKIKSLSDEFMRELTDLPWRGNVRELRNYIERARALGELQARPLSRRMEDEAATSRRPVPAARETVAPPPASLPSLRNFDSEPAEATLATDAQLPSALPRMPAADRLPVELGAFPSAPAAAVSAPLPTDPTTMFEGSYKAFRERWIDQGERMYIAHMLERHDGNVAAIAKEADVDRTYIYRLMRRHKS
jgi:serine/threonine-protein kinase